MEQKQFHVELLSIYTMTVQKSLCADENQFARRLNSSDEIIR